MAEFLSTGLGIGIVVGVCALALIRFLYGVFRRFSRCSWLSWQILILFAATFLLRFLPASDSAAVNAALAPIVLFAAVALVLAIGGWTRHGLLAYAKRPPAFFRFTNRFLGGVTTVLNFVTFFVVIGAPVLVALPLFGVNFAALGPLYASAIWSNYAAPPAFGLVVVAVCVLMVRCGYRVGLMRSLWAILTVLLCFGALVLAIFLANKVPFLANWANALAGNFASLGSYASVVGTAIVAGVCFVVLLIVIILISALINVLMKKLRTPTALRAIDGALLAVIFGAIFFAIAFGIDFGVYYLAHGGLENAFGAIAGAAGSAAEGGADALQGALDSVSAVMQRLEQLFLSSPLSARLYNYNPLLLLGQG